MSIPLHVPQEQHGAEPADCRDVCRKHSAAMRAAQEAPSPTPQRPGCPCRGLRDWASSTLCVSLCCAKHDQWSSDLLLSNTLRTDCTRLPQCRSLSVAGKSAAVRSAFGREALGSSRQALHMHRVLKKFQDCSTTRCVATPTAKRGVVSARLTILQADSAGCGAGLQGRCMELPGADAALRAYQACESRRGNTNRAGGTSDVGRRHQGAADAWRANAPVLCLTTLLTWIHARSRTTRSGQQRHMHLHGGRRRSCFATVKPRSRRADLQQVVRSPGCGARGRLSIALRTARALRRCCGGGGGSGSLPCERQGPQLPAVSFVSSAGPVCCSSAIDCPCRFKLLVALCTHAVKCHMGLLAPRPPGSVQGSVVTMVTACMTAPSGLKP